MAGAGSGVRRVKNMNKFERHVSIVSFVRSPRAHHTVLEFTPTPTRGGLEGREAHREFDASEDEHSESVSVGGSTDNTRVNRNVCNTFGAEIVDS